MQLNHLPEPAGGSGDELLSHKATWSSAGHDVDGLRDSVGKTLAKLEEGQHGLGKEPRCLSAGAQHDVYESWKQYFTKVSKRCGTLADVLEKAGRDHLTTDDAVRLAIDGLKTRYTDTAAIGGRAKGAVTGLDFATLKAFKPSEFQDAADGFRSSSTMASAAKDTIDNQIARGSMQPAEGRSGEAAAISELRDCRRTSTTRRPNAAW